MITKSRRFEKEQEIKLFKDISYNKYNGNARCGNSSNDLMQVIMIS